MTLSQAQPTVPEAPSLRAVGVSKAFGRVQALDEASLDAWAGQVTALVGDNGAGKSTMIKIIAGLYPPDAGQIEVDGTPVTFATPMDAVTAGIATVFQDLALVEVLDVATNMYLGRPQMRGVFVDERRMHEEAADRLQELRMRVPSVRVPVGMLSGGQRQAVAVARAFAQGSRIILMDEPTAALGIRERTHVLELVQQLRDQGHTVVVISHDLETIFDVSDNIQVMRLGRRVGFRRTADTNRQEIVALITGSLAADGESS
jgi:ABC-type sugar transport system ATPase subunit